MDFGLSPGALDKLLRHALAEDAPHGDRTTEALGLAGNGRAVLLAKQELVACGVPACLRRPVYVPSGLVILESMST